MKSTARSVSQMPDDDYEAAVAVARRENLSGFSGFVRRAVRRQLGTYSEERAGLADYDAIEITIPPGKHARFALLVPEMERCEYDGKCPRCAAFLHMQAPDLVLSDDRFKWNESEGRLTMERPGFEFVADGEAEP